jgi:hypothetical protein
MTREEKILMAIERGYTCNTKTGEVFGVKGELLKCKCSGGYIIISFKFNGKGIQIKTHQFIWYNVYKECVDVIDHINQVKDDNRISNLRSITKQQNAFNTRAKGYTWHKIMKKWMSSIKVNGDNKHLGYFLTEQEASTAYQDAKKIYHII